MCMCVCVLVCVPQHVYVEDRSGIACVSSLLLPYRCQKLNLSLSVCFSCWAILLTFLNWFIFNACMCEGWRATVDVFLGNPAHLFSEMLTDRARLASQRAPGPLLFPPLQFRNCKHVTPDLAYLIWVLGLNSGLCDCKQAIYWQNLFPKASLRLLLTSAGFIGLRSKE